MKKLFLQAVICVNLITGVQASAEVEDRTLGDEECPIALRTLCRTVQAGPFQIEPIAPSGELRGFVFPGFDGTLYKFFEKREFVSGHPYCLLDYGCGSGRWAAMAALQGELDNLNVAYTAHDPFMQTEHAEYYNQAWSNYVRENGSSHGAFLAGQGWLRDIASTTPEKFNAVLVRDAIHLFSDEQVSELFQLGSTLTPENGSIVVHATPPFASMFWHPRVQIFMHMQNLTPPNFGEIFFNMFSYKVYLDYLAHNTPGVLGKMNKKSVCLPAIRNSAVANGWWLQAIQVGTTVMTHTKPLTEEQLYTFVLKQIMKLKPKLEEYNLDYRPRDPSIVLRFKKNPAAQVAEAK
ncbi:MAG: hypothetical protein Q8Q56_02495 [Alphaproteobacteria bacterium]|nr:hypothetical protein [Alphaproteobacteria bacterium]